MTKVKVWLLILVVCLSGNVQAFVEKEVKVYSTKMSKDIPVNIILPDSYNAARSYPTVYLLHGYSDNHKSWSRQGVVGALADQYQFIVVMPDGNYSSWYFDSPLVADSQYETFVGKELVAFVDSTFSTLRHRKARAVSGLSMGGHGAFYVCLKHQDVFGIVGSLSGAVDIRPFKSNWRMANLIGTYDEHKEWWEQNTIVNMTHLIAPDSLDITFECGTADFFYQVNCELHDKLLKEGVDHDFYVRPGGHNWAYWLNAIKYQFLFFDGCFRKASR